MIKQMKRIPYEAPVTERFRVEMEGSFCSASAEIENPNTSTGKIEEHSINTGFAADNFETGSWSTGEQ